MRFASGGLSSNALQVRPSVLLLVSVCCLQVLSASAQDAGAPREAGPTAPAPRVAEPSIAPTKVDVKLIARDDQIQQRLQSVLEATHWFQSPQVEVRHGVVFINGVAETETLKHWAGDLARNTQDVAAVVNRLVVPEPSIWDFRPAWTNLRQIWRDAVSMLPLFVVGILIILLSMVCGALVSHRVKVALGGRIKARLLRIVIARGAGVLVVLFGTYIVLRVGGLTQLAMTVVGGTGLAGLVLGIAFRTITENFLASVFLSMQQPFEQEDLVEIAGVTGYVQNLNVRTTVLMTLNGNIVQIPNTTVYGSQIRNFTTNANRREDFVVGIGIADSIAEAQEIARKVLADHPAVLKDPEPSALADSLDKGTVNLRIYFWLNGHDHSWLKVKSSVIRMIKLAFQKEGISMPDESREVVFPRGIPVTMVEGTSPKPPSAAAETQVPPPNPPVAADAASTPAEAGLYSEAGVIEGQVRNMRPLKEGENLLQSAKKTGPAGMNTGGE